MKFDQFLEVLCVLLKMKLTPLTEGKNNLKLFCDLLVLKLILLENSIEMRRTSGLLLTTGLSYRSCIWSHSFLFFYWLNVHVHWVISLSVRE